MRSETLPLSHGECSALRCKPHCVPVLPAVRQRVPGLPACADEINLGYFDVVCCQGGSFPPSTLAMDTIRERHGRREIA
jgi:hypothetical protein